MKISVCIESMEAIEIAGNCYRVENGQGPFQLVDDGAVLFYGQVCTEIPESIINIIEGTMVLAWHVDAGPKGDSCAFFGYYVKRVGQYHRVRNPEGRFLERKHVRAVTMDDLLGGDWDETRS